MSDPLVALAFGQVCDKRRAEVQKGLNVLEAVRATATANDASAGELDYHIAYANFRLGRRAAAKLALNRIEETSSLQSQARMLAVLIDDRTSLDWMLFGAAAVSLVAGVAIGRWLLRA